MNRSLLDISVRATALHSATAEGGPAFVNPYSHKQVANVLRGPYLLLVAFSRAVLIFDVALDICRIDTS